jgi:tetratricopeptide (TPR) repeat protein
LIRVLIAAALALAAFSVTVWSAGTGDVRAEARAAELSGNFAKAESLYSAALNAHPDADLYQRLGLVRHLQNKFRPAAAAFEQALRLDPNLWSSHLFLGIDDYRLSRFQEALPHLKQADKLNPNVNEIRFWLGATQLALHQYWDGLSALESVLGNDPKNVDVLRLLAESYGDFGTHVLSQIAEKYPESAAGLEVEGKAFEFEGSNKAALDAYLKAAAKNPNLPGIRESIERMQSILPK